jgi:hypothetical protein
MCTGTPTPSTVEIAVACVGVYQDGRVIDKSTLTGAHQRMIMDSVADADY